MRTVQRQRRMRRRLRTARTAIPSDDVYRGKKKKKRIRNDRRRRRRLRYATGAGELKPTADDAAHVVCGGTARCCDGERNGARWVAAAGRVEHDRRRSILRRVSRRRTTQSMRDDDDDVSPPTCRQTRAARTVHPGPLRLFGTATPTHVLAARTYH